MPWAYVLSCSPDGPLSEADFDRAVTRLRDALAYDRLVGRAERSRTRVSQSYAASRLAVHVTSGDEGDHVSEIWRVLTLMVDALPGWHGFSVARARLHALPEREGGCGAARP